MKALLRMQNLQKRNSLNAREIEQKSRIIQSKLFSLEEFKKAEKILFYAGVKSEVQTRQMILDALALGKTIAVPKSDFEKKTMKAIRINSLADLEETKFGLLEPKKGKEIPANELGLVIVPGVAFDLKGNRLGYGGGFFDKFLKKTKCPKIGLAFECNIEESLPSSPHDVKMDKIITEEKIAGV
ncbi:MAG: 5-formyltetrahydrofolate cyclo-ligase [Candidatus ainarchaeum sp.]|nr:5-formyltetrahydrofolate cyclo-ligase [Candidatus ainarchaeum sp.]